MTSALAWLAFLSFLAMMLLIVLSAEEYHPRELTKIVKTKIKDFFCSKEKENTMYYNPHKPCEPPSSDPSSDDLRALYQEVQSKDAEIKYAKELKRIQKDLTDKDLYLERLYAHEDEFETLYAVIHQQTTNWHPLSEYGSRWVQGIYQTRVEAEAKIKNIEGSRIEEFKYLPNKEEE